MKRKARHRGFVLLLVLVVLAIAATVMTLAARRYTEDVVRVGAARRELQVRWGMLGCRATILPIADGLLNERETLADPVVPEATCTVTLGDIRFRMGIGDESAKLNANLLAFRSGDLVLSQSISRVQLGGRAAGPGDILLPQLQPAERPVMGAGGVPMRYASFDQLFDLRGPSDLFGGPDAPGDAARRRITCWGGALVNLRRADVAVLEEALYTILPPGSAKQLDEFRRKHPGCTIRQALAGQKLTRDQVESASRAMTTISDTFSLWVAASDRQRSWYRLYIQKGDGQSAEAPSWAFAW